MNGTGADSEEIGVVMAAHNEEGAVGAVVRRSREVLGPAVDILVVDDGSTDGTAAEAEAAGARVLRLWPNGGKGAAMRAGIAASRADWLVFIDADGQDDPGEIPVLLAERKADVALINGSRFLGELKSGSIHPANRVGNIVLTRLFAKLFGQAITDSQAGFRVVRGDLLRTLPLRGDEYEFETEVLGRLLRQGRRVVEVPVTREARAAGSTDFRRVRNGLRILGTMLALRVGARGAAR
ncbi:MAG: glycosyltransferase family 2 protein [Myxococcota bacterium]|nr:glycosyltransferase family 2 protein [Myxococcota bacterium]